MNVQQRMLSWLIAITFLILIMSPAKAVVITEGQYANYVTTCRLPPLYSDGTPVLSNEVVQIRAYLNGVLVATSAVNNCSVSIPIRDLTEGTYNYSISAYSSIHDTESPLVSLEELIVQSVKTLEAPTNISTTLE